MEQYDVLIIGAGAAGMIAALEIALTGRKVCVLEAKDRCGGRINTIYTEAGYPIELGAEFVHGNLPITQELLKKAGARMFEVKGSIWQKKEEKLHVQEDFIEDYSTLEKKFAELPTDISVKEFFETYLRDSQFEELRFTLQNYVEGYYAADINKSSTYALREELTKGDDKQYRIEDGYQVLVDYLEEQCKEKGVQFFFSQPVNQLQWKRNEIEAITLKGRYKAKKVLVTVSIGVLQSEGITFFPSLPEKSEAARQLGFGHVLKINHLFDDAFWKKENVTSRKDLSNLNFLFSEETIPTWWTQHPKKEPLLTGWLGGPKAKIQSTLTPSAVFQKSLHSLSNIFDIDVIHLSQQQAATYFYNWSTDPFFNGAYSYAILNGQQYMRQILEPAENTVYFAGEGLHHGNEIGTVEAALQSGRSVSQQIITAF